MKDYTGKRFGRLKVTEFSHIKRYGNGHSTKSFWKCRCDCGKEVIVIGENLVSGNTTSCGCLAREKSSKRTGKLNLIHGLSNSPEYSSYASMISRVVRPDKHHKIYYQNIKITERWLGREGFKNFLEDMGPKAMPSDTIERVNNMGDYEPDNCKWATRKEQAANRRPRGSVIRNW